MNLLSVARRYIALNLSVLPGDHTTKQPLFALLPRNEAGKATWAPFQNVRADDQQLEAWFTQDCVKALAILAGSISGGLQIIDFDAAADRLFPAFMKEAAAIVANPLIIQTGAEDGTHRQFYFLCPGLVAGNKKLAWIADDAARNGKTIAIETRGEGGYTIAPPSLHPSGRTYNIDEGSFDEIPVVTPEQAEALFNIARSLDECPLDNNQMAEIDRQFSQTKSASRNGSGSVIEQFNRKHDIRTLLGSFGYPPVSGDWLGRPGKPDAKRVLIRGQKCFCFSSNDALNDGKFGHGVCGVHDAFDVFCILQHGGDFKAAVKAAAKELGIEYQPKKNDAPTPAHHVAEQKPDPEAVTLPAIDPYAPFPVDQLPVALVGFVREAKAAIQVDAAFVVSPLLASLGAAIGNTAIVLIKRGFTQPALLWTSVVADSGSAKTPGQNAATEPVKRQQTRLNNEYQRQLQDYMEELARYEAIQKKDRTEDDKPPEKPTLQHTFVSDITCEALAVRLQQNPRGVLSLQDELAGFFKSFNSYKNGGRDLESFLSMYDASYAKIDRKTADAKTLIIPRAYVAITGGIQPGILAEHLNSANVDSGLFGRFLFCYPPTRRRAWTEDEISESTEQALGQVYERLYSLPLQQDETDIKPQVLPLTDAAKRAWGEWFAEVEDEIHATPESPYRVALPKIRSAAARFALVFQLVSFVSERNVYGTCIDETSMTRGIAIARWYMREQRRVYAALAMSKEQRSLVALQHAVEELGGSVSVREWHRRRHRKSEEAERDLHRLVMAGVAEWRYSDAGTSGGRPSKTLHLKDKTPSGNSANEGFVGRQYKEVEVEPFSIGKETPIEHPDSPSHPYNTDETRVGDIANDGFVFSGGEN